MQLILNIMEPLTCPLLHFGLLPKLMILPIVFSLASTQQGPSPSQSRKPESIHSKLLALLRHWECTASGKRVRRMPSMQMYHMTSSMCEDTRGGIKRSAMRISTSLSPIWMPSVLLLLIVPMGLDNMPPRKSSSSLILLFVKSPQCFCCHWGQHRRGPRAATALGSIWSGTRWYLLDQDSCWVLCVIKNLWVGSLAATH